jgi:putative membrane protein
MPMDIEFHAPAARRHEDETDFAYQAHRERRDVLKGAISGFVGGLVGTWLMSEYQGWWSRRVDGVEPQSAGGRHDARDWEEKNEGNNANEQASQAVARRTAGRELTRRELEVAAPVLHYAFGGALGAAYGTVAERAPWATAGLGTAYGTTVWAGADEIAMPAIGWSDPRRFKLQDHVQSFTAHLVFGLATEVTRRGVRRMLH